MSVSIAGQKRCPILLSDTRQKKAIDRNEESPHGKRDESRPAMKAKSPYVCFSLAKQNEIKKMLGPSTSINAVAKCIARTWKDLSDEERKKWIEESERDEEKCRNAVITKKKPSVAVDVIVIDDDKDDEDKGTLSKRYKTYYTIFSKEMRAVIRRKSPEMLGNIVSKILGKIWKLLPYYERSKYSARKIKDGKLEEVAALHWEEYHKEVMTKSNDQYTNQRLSGIRHPNVQDENKFSALSNSQSAYNANHSDSFLRANLGIPDDADISRPYRHRLGAENPSLTSSERALSLRAMHSQQPPQRPSSAYSIFCDKVLPAVKANNPTMLRSELSKELLTLWKNYPETERNIYLMQEAQEFAIYQVALAEWHTRNANVISRSRDSLPLPTSSLLDDRLALYGNARMHSNLYGGRAFQQGISGSNLTDLSSPHLEQLEYLSNSGDIPFQSLPRNHNLSGQPLILDDIAHLQAQLNAQRRMNSDYQLLYGGQAQNSSQIRLLNQHLDDRELEDLAMMRYASYYGQRPGL